MKVSKYTVIRPGEILMVNFGKTTVKGHPHGVRPAYVIGQDDMTSRDKQLIVIPLYRSPSRLNADTDIQIKKEYCHGLRYDQYADIFNIQKIERYRVRESLGRVTESSVKQAFNDSFRLLYN